MNPLTTILFRNRDSFHPVVQFNPASDKLLKMDFTSANQELTAAVINDTEAFSVWVENKLQLAGARYGIGGYAEVRAIYDRSNVFDSDKPGDEPRRLHLGVDIWGPAGTPVYAFAGGMVHSVAFNNQYGDYGATMIVLHQLDGVPFYTLYGHISLSDIQGMSAGRYIIRGQEIAHFGVAAENGNWPPHLHFQVISDMELKQGDYPGVCKYSERGRYLYNCPDPDNILNLNRFLGND